jgi:hypothetical protein
MNDPTDPRLLLLDERDNVLVVRTSIRAGETVAVGAAAVTVERNLPLGHKLARRAIAPGEKVVKYGAPIGSATAAIDVGAHVHVHNLASDYTPTYHLDEARAAHGGGA